MMHITEDTPPDMLAGAMDLTVHLPSGRPVKMSVERSTPMMDLLVQITTAHNLQLSSHILHALAMAPSADTGDTVLPYKPNTPIGALDTQHIKVVPKNKTQSAAKSVPPGHQPFESTFRLKVHLPRNQLYVTRVSRNVHLEEIMSKVCKEKDLDPVKYELRHPRNLTAVLDPKLTLNDYQITEIFVVVKGAGNLAQGLSTSDIMALRKIEEERKQFQAKTGGGVFNLIFRRGKTSAPNGSVSSNENRSISPSDDSRSVTPPAVPPPIIKEPPPQDKPKPPQRKRRPAPKPPQPQEAKKDDKPPSQISNSSNQSDTSSKKADNGLLICHSRNSSDSSGYHEASILSDNCNTSLPRRPRTMYEDSADGRMVNGEHSRSIGNLAKMSLQSKSTTSLVVPGRKKKAAPPPPPVKKVEESVEKPSPVVARLPVEANTESISTVPTTNNTPPESPLVQPQPASTSTPNFTRNTLSNPTPPATPAKETIKETDTKSSTIKTKEEEAETKKTDEVDSGICENTLSDSTEKDELEVENDWQYQLPSPPKGFRDVSPSVRTESSNYEVETIPDSVVTSPELFEKLKHVQDVQSVASDLPSVVSEVEEKEMCNKLTLENLEKRKTLVYNRELATSLKYAQEEPIERKKVINELEDVITNTSSILRPSRPISRSSTLPDNRHLPNFKISTYDGKKEKVNIFEDDTIRSNEKSAVKNATSMENLSFFKKEYPKQEEEEVFKKPQQPALPSATLNINRSESFSVNSQWSPANPVKRSKSQAALNRNKDGNRTAANSGDGTLSKSNSLRDVSGLQSVEVMRMIQTKLNSSRDTLDHVAEEQQPSKAEVKPEPKPTPQPKATTPTTYTSKPFQPPSINLCAWSQRPKCEVTLKEDTDYKLGVGASKPNLKSTPSFNGYKPQTEVTHKQNGVNIKINSTEPIVQQKSGNVVIKIGGGDQKEPERPSNNFQNDVFRRPLGNHVEKSRPHSIAFDTQSTYAPPIVRSVELKKEFQDSPVAKSITQITGHVEPQHKSLTYTNSFSVSDKNSSVYLSNESLNKPVFRTKSFVNPIVKGFSNNNNNRMTWNAYGTLPAKEDLNTNKNVPFSQSNLRRTDSNKVLNGNNNTNNNSNIFGNVVLRNNTNSFKTKDPVKPIVEKPLSQPTVVPPPAPPMAKLATKPAKFIEPTVDSKDLLLQEIRNFGGKKGLKART